MTQCWQFNSDSWWKWSEEEKTQRESENENESIFHQNGFFSQWLVNLYIFLRHLLHWDVRFFVVTNTLVSMSLCILAFIVKQRNWRIVNWKAQRKLFFSHRMKFNGIDDRREFIAEVYRLYGNCAVNDIHIERDWIWGDGAGSEKESMKHSKIYCN